MNVKEIYQKLHDLEQKAAAYERLEKDNGRKGHADDHRKEKEALRFAIEMMESQLKNMLT